MRRKGGSVCDLGGEKIACEYVFGYVGLAVSGYDGAKFDLGITYCMVISVNNTGRMLTCSPLFMEFMACPILGLREGMTIYRYWCASCAGKVATRQQDTGSKSPVPWETSGTRPVLLPCADPLTHVVPAPPTIFPPA